MNYWLHPEAQEDLREAAEFYREQAGIALSQSFLAEFEYSVGLLPKYPHLGAMWRGGIAMPRGAAQVPRRGPTGLRAAAAPA